FPPGRCLMVREMVLLLVLLPLVLANGAGDEPRRKPGQRGPVELTEEGLRIHREALVVDGHNDLPWQYRAAGDLSFQQIDIRKKRRDLHRDLPRLKKGGLGAQFWSAYVSPSTRKDGVTVRQTLEQIDVIHRLVKEHPDSLEMAYTVDDILRIRKKG